MRREPKMETQPRFENRDVAPIARELVEMFEPYAHQISIAGSLRRKKHFIKDVEILIRPKCYSLQSGLFGDDEDNDQYSEAKRFADELASAGVIAPILDPEKMVPVCWGQINFRFRYKGVPVDMFSVMPGQSWGVKLALYTGPAEFSQKLVTGVLSAGFLKWGQRISHGNLYQGDEIVPCPTENDLFAALDLPWIEPDMRK